MATVLVLAATVWMTAIHASPLVGPETLGVVVNTRDETSRAIAEYYIHRRAIPAGNVIEVAFDPGNNLLTAREFASVNESVLAQTPPHVQAFLLSWALPFRVGCMSITTAFAAGGFDEAWCAKGCAVTKRSPYFDSDSASPYGDLGWRPTMSIGALTLEQAIATIDRGVAADGTAPRGSGYLVRTPDRARNVRAPDFPRIVERYGEAFDLHYVQAPFIRDRKDVLFYFTGASNVEMLDSNRFLPGAIADHLTSSGGRLRGGKQMTVLRWLEAGATASYGTVTEPCNIVQKFPDPEIVIGRYLAGETLLEAYWKSVEMPGQGLFVGEPLARPFAARGNGK
jgi:uncharacterized protein (TIGR03790 family)